jgi:hypothetical protein
MVVVDPHGVGLRQRLAGGEVSNFGMIDLEVPADRAVPAGLGDGGVERERPNIIGGRKYRGGMGVRGVGIAEDDLAEGRKRAGAGIIMHGTRGRREIDNEDVRGSIGVGIGEIGCRAFKGDEAAIGADSRKVTDRALLDIAVGIDRHLHGELALGVIDEDGCSAARHRVAEHDITAVGADVRTAEG